MLHTALMPACIERRSLNYVELLPSAQCGSLVFYGGLWLVIRGCSCSLHDCAILCKCLSVSIDTCLSCMMVPFYAMKKHTKKTKRDYGIIV